MAGEMIGDLCPMCGMLTALDDLCPHCGRCYDCICTSGHGQRGYEVPALQEEE